MSGGEQPGSAVEIAGGGDIAVETGPMLAAAALLRDLHGTVAAARRVLSGAAGAGVLQAVALLDRALAAVDRAAAGLTVAAARYGTAEHVATAASLAVAQTSAAVRGTTASLLGPPGVLLLVQSEVAAAAAFVAGSAVRELVTTGRVDPQSDPVVIAAVRLRIASLDDELRGLLLVERPDQLLRDDPSAPLGTESIAASVALLWPGAAGPMTVRHGATRAVRAPEDLAALADRLPDAAGGQVRVERYDGPGGRRWIVYSAGTAAWSPWEDPAEPFDFGSDLLGVAHRPADSQLAVLAAMRDAGVRPDEPVLLVGHSQGALNAVRVAQDGGYRVDGVVQFGGPTGQIALPADVPVLSVEHTQDVVPVLGGAAAAGAPGLRRLVVRRSLPSGGRLPGMEQAFPGHEMRNYRETVRQAEASGSPRVAAFEARIGGFLGGEGTAVRYRADRVEPVSGPRDPRRAAAGPARPASR